MKTNPIGNLIVSMIYGVPEKKINSNRFLRKAMYQGLVAENFSVLKTVSHKFQPHGITLVYILGESSLVVHTYPEYGCLELQLSTCRGPESGETAFEKILSKIPHTKYTKRVSKTIKDENYLEEIVHYSKPSV